MSFDSIPILDISKFESERTTFVSDFGVAYEEWGFAGIIGHEVETETIKSAFSAAKDFFALSDQQKRQYMGPDGLQRGYVPFGVEKAKDAKHKDLKEFYHIGREINGVAHLQENLWPSETANFRQAFVSLYAALDQLAIRILAAVALHFDLPIDYFDKRINHGEALLRVLHYPPITDQNAPNLRAAEHEDINLITLLVGSEQAGLEVLSRQGNWVPISMIEGTIICNVGDMMQRLSNARLPSTTHRVVNPKGDEARTSRYSIPFFVHPNPDMALDSLSQCIDADHPALYPPISAGEFHSQRLREIGLIK